MEEGRVVFYNLKAGKGKLILASGEKFDFSIDILDGFASKPENGAPVKCIIENDVLKSVEPLEKNISTDENDAQESPTYSVSQTLKSYFNSIVGESQEIKGTKAQLDYFLSKRFLITSYNNLKNLDPSLHDHKDIKEKITVLNDLQKVYHTVSGSGEVSQIAFEIIFLRSQPEYMQCIKDKEVCVNRISVLATMISSLLPEIEQGEAELKKMAKKDKKRQVLEDKLKPLRGNYVDSIHEKAELEKQLTEMKDIKAIYTEKYFDDFVSKLSELSGEYKSILSKILNHKAYELDNEIWKHASKSKLIQGYFDDAGIEGDYSTKTFLTYYLSTLDKRQLGDDQVKLFKLLEYLKKQPKDIL